MPSNKNSFAANQASIQISRSRFNMPFKHKTTFNAGYCIPLFSYSDVMPGDTFKIDLSSLVRMATPVAPVMDDAYLDIYFFFTPHDLVMHRQSFINSSTALSAASSWDAFIGAQDGLLNMPLPGTDDVLPKQVNGTVVALGSFRDYLGFPVGVGINNSHVHMLDYLAYCMIWNDFFRDENTQNPVVATLYGSSGSYFYEFVGGPSNWTGIGTPDLIVDGIFPACRPHGYFGSALPWPQRNLTGVTIPLLGSATVAQFPGFRSLQVVGGTSGTYGTLEPSTTGDSVAVKVVSSGDDFTQGESLRYANGLSVDLSDVSSVTINQLRLLIAQQHWYEQLARSGNRIGELTASMFGVKPHDLGDKRPEYLGGKRIYINTEEVAQTAPNSTSGTSGDDGIGTLGAFSKTGDRSHFVEKSFDKWGTITCIAVVRTNESFCQGINRRFTRQTREDFFWPAYANIGEQPILNRELYATNTATDAADEGVFGYQEAWAEYRYLPDIVSGRLRPGQDLGYFTYANNFASLPTLAGYLKGGSDIADNIDRTLQVARGTSGFQFIGDFAFDIEAIRPMPTHSIPGLNKL